MVPDVLQEGFPVAVEEALGLPQASHVPQHSAQEKLLPKKKLSLAHHHGLLERLPKVGTCSGNPSRGLAGDDSFARSTPLGFGAVGAAAALTRVGLTDQSTALGVFGAIFGGVLGSSFPDALGTCPAAFGASLVDAAFGTSFTGVLEDFFFLTRVVERNRGCGIMMVMISTFFQDDDSQHFSLESEPGPWMVTANHTAIRDERCS